MTNAAGPDAKRNCVTTLRKINKSLETDSWGALTPETPSRYKVTEKILSLYVV